MRLLGYNKRQQRLLGHFPDDRLAFNHNKPSDPAFWHLSGADALHWQARSLYTVHRLLTVYLVVAVLSLRMHKAVLAVLRHFERRRSASRPESTRPRT